MILFLVLAAGLWGLGAMLKVSTRARWTMIAMLYAVALVSALILPGRSPFGGTAGEWAVVGGGVALFLAYRWGLQRLRSQTKGDDATLAETPPETAKGGSLSEPELNRYMRHIVLREIGGTGQRQLKEARVLVIGAGGLGAPVLQYLAAAGVGTLGVVDDDVVDLSNLQRQVIHTDARIGMPKVFSAAEALAEVNPHVVVRPYNRRFDAGCAPMLDDYDLVIDGCDNFETRYLVNRLCVAAGKPLVAAAITQWEGQISTYNAQENAPCYQCVFPKAPAEGMVPSCAEAGVAAPLPGIIGSLMAMEAVKQVTGAGQGLSGRLMIYDALYAEPRVIAVKKRADCPVCGG